MKQPLELVNIRPGDEGYTDIMQSLKIAQERIKPFAKMLVEENKYSLCEIMAWAWMQGFVDAHPIRSTPNTSSFTNHPHL